MEAPEGTGVDARILHPVASPGRDAMGQFKAHLGYLISPAQRASLSRTRVDQLDPAGLKKDGFELSLDRTRHWFGVPRRSAYYRLAVAQESGSRRNRRYWSRSSLRRSRRSAAATRRAGMSRAVRQPVLLRRILHEAHYSRVCNGWWLGKTGASIVTN